MMARARPRGSCARHQSTGAEAVLERVSTPATVLPGSSTIRQRSGRPWTLMPQAAVAKLRPAIAGSLGKPLGAKGERCKATEGIPDRSLLHQQYKSGRSKRSEEHTSELQSLMRISYAVFCLKKNKQNRQSNKTR